MEHRRIRRSAGLALSVGTLFAGSTLAIGGGIAEASPLISPPSVQGNNTVVVSNVGQLEYIDQNQTAPIQSGSSTTYMDATIELEPGQTFDLSQVSSWVPLGNTADPFTGTFNGEGDTVSGLQLSVSNVDEGLFGVSSGTIENLTLSGTTITGSAQTGDFGALVGSQHGGTIDNITVSGDSITVDLPSSASSGSLSVGGLVGRSSGAIVENIHEHGGTVKSQGTGNMDFVGGLLGEEQNGSLTSATVSGTTLNGALKGYVYAQSVPTGAFGGVVGFDNMGTVDQVTADNISMTAAPTGSVSGDFGALVGEQAGGTIEASDATGTITANGSGNLGGLVGQQYYGIISGSHAAVDVSSGFFNGGLVGVQSTHTTLGQPPTTPEIQDSYAAGSVTEDNVTNGANGGLVGIQFYQGSIHDSYATGSVQGSMTTASASGGAPNGGLVGEQDFGGTISDSYATGSVTGNLTTAVGTYADAGNGGLVGDQNYGGTIANSYATGKVGGTDNNNGGLVGIQWGSSGSVPSIGDSYEAGTVSGGLYNGGLVGAASTGSISGAVFLSEPNVLAVASPTGETTASVASASLQQMTAPFEDSTSPFYPWMTSATWDQVSGTNNGLPVLLFEVPAPKTPTGPAVPAWTPPVLTPETVTVDGMTAEVIGNLGYNPEIAIQNGSFAGYVEERAAIDAGASFTGQDTNSSYMSSILSGSGVGTQAHVSAVQQGQFAALYQKLGIIPTWTRNTTTLAQGLTALEKAGASSLAMENYLVQIGGYSWSAATVQDAMGFPVTGTPIIGSLILSQSAHSSQSLMLPSLLTASEGTSLMAPIGNSGLDAYGLKAGMKGMPYVNLVNIAGAIWGSSGDTLQITSSDPSVVSLVQGLKSGSTTNNGWTLGTDNATATETLGKGVRLPMLWAVKPGTATVTITDISEPTWSVSFTVSVTSSTKKTTSKQ